MSGEVIHDLDAAREQIRSIEFEEPGAEAWIMLDRLDLQGALEELPLPWDLRVEVTIAFEGRYDGGNMGRKTPYLRVVKLP